MSQDIKTAIVTQSESTPIEKIQPTDMKGMWWLAKAIADSGIKPDALKKPSDVLIVLMTGTELGLSAMQSLRGIHVIKGKPALSADTMGAIVQSDERCEYLQITEWTDECCEYETKRKGHKKPVTVSFTMEDARRAELLGNHMWKKYPGEMLKARALTKICRAVYPDICMGLYDPEELTNIQQPQPRQQQPAEPEYSQIEPQYDDHDAIDAEFEEATAEASAEELPEAPTGPTDYSDDPRHHEKTKWLYTLVTECGLTQDDGDRVREFLKDFRKVESWKHLSPEFIHANCEKLAKMSPKDGDNGEMSERASRILGMISNTPAPAQKTTTPKLPPQFADLKILVADAVLENDATAYFQALAKQHGATAFDALDIAVIQSELERLEKLSEDIPPHTPVGTPSPRAAAILGLASQAVTKKPESSVPAKTYGEDDHYAKEWGERHIYDQGYADEESTYY